MLAKAKHLRVVKNSEKRPVTAKRLPNSAYQTREHLTEKEMGSAARQPKGKPPRPSAKPSSSMYACKCERLVSSNW